MRPFPRFDARGTAPALASLEQALAVVAVGVAFAAAAPEGRFAAGWRMIAQGFKTMFGRSP